MILSIRSEVWKIPQSAGGVEDGCLLAPGTSLSSRRIILFSGGLFRLSILGFSDGSPAIVELTISSGCGRTTLLSVTLEAPSPDTILNKPTDSVTGLMTRTTLMSLLAEICSPFSQVSSNLRTPTVSNGLVPPKPLLTKLVSPDAKLLSPRWKAGPSLTGSLLSRPMPTARDASTPSRSLSETKNTLSCETDNLNYR